VTGSDDLWRSHWPADHHLPPSDQQQHQAGSAHPTLQPNSGSRNSWRSAYSRLRRSQCVECGLSTRHLFTPLNRRLCVACEQQNPAKYGLASELEATDRFGLTAAALEGLPSVFTLRRRWFLRSAVEAAAASLSDCGGESSGGEDEAAAAAVGNSVEGESSDAQHHAGQSAADAAEAEGSSTPAADDDADQAAVQLSALEVQHAQREARRAERKQNKKQAKAEQRAIREAKSAGLHWPGSDTVRGRVNQNSGSHHHQLGRSPGSGHGGASGSGSSWRGTNLHIRDRKKAKYLDQRQQQQQQRGKLSGARRVVNGGGRSSSAWLAEREALMEEFGSFDASGLVLADG